MADYNKIGLLVLSEDRNSFLVCEPGSGYLEKKVKQYLMPGGQLELESELECLQREIREELGSDIEIDSVTFIDEYIDVAATPGKTVMIKLYSGVLLGTPKPSSEIGTLHWATKEDVSNEKLSPIIRNKIIPDLVKRNILQ